MTRVGLSDTSPEAQRVLDAVYRSMSPARKWALLDDLLRTMRTLHKAGFRMRNPGATPAQVRDEWLAIRLGKAPRIRSLGPDAVGPPMDDLRVVLGVLATFDALGILHALGGSLASSIHGAPRTTNHAVVFVEPFDGLDGSLVASFGPDHDVSPEAIRRALLDRASFQIINTSVGFKVAVFVLKDRPFEQSLMSRRVLASLGDATDRPIAVISPEDLILLKLEWYRLGGETSETQWLDVLGDLRVQGDRLDAAYLDHWAATLGVLDLLHDARRDADI